MENKTFTIPEASKLLGLSTQSIRRYLKRNVLKGDLVKGRYGEEWHIYYESIKNLIGNNGKGKKGKNFSNVESQSILLDYGQQVNKELQSALIQLGVFQNKIENYERMLTAGETEKKELNERMNKKDILIGRLKLATIIASSAFVLTLALAIAVIMFF